MSLGRFMTEFVRHSRTFVLPLLVAYLCLSQSAKAQTTWYANVGAESHDEAKQADAFLPNEVWIHAGDSIQWTFVPKNEVHTVSFLAQNTTPQEVRPPAPVPVGPPQAFGGGCPPPAPGPFGIVPSGSSYDGTSCVTSAPSSGGAKYTVTFPTPGNYKLVCLVHADMNGTVHVLSMAEDIHHIQADYDRAGREEAETVLSDDDNRGEDEYRGNWNHSRDNEVIAGVGHIVATGGGRQYLSVVRFLQDTIKIHVGETVEWTNLDPTEPHTVTFGTEPAGFIPTTQVGVSSPAPDGALDTTISSTSAFVNSGFLQAAPQDRIGLAQSPAGTTRIRITFTKPGTYQYHCALHDVDGMIGKVIVE